MKLDWKTIDNLIDRGVTKLKTTSYDRSNGRVDTYITELEFAPRSQTTAPSKIEEAPNVDQHERELAELRRRANETDDPDLLRSLREEYRQKKFAAIAYASS